MKRVIWAVVAACLAAVAGCSTNNTTMKGRDYYLQAEYLYSKGEYNAAREIYQHLVDDYPFSPYAEDAELKIALANYQVGHYPEAIAALDDFQRMHPTNPNIPLAQYYLAMSYYKQVGRPDQDQTNTEEALKQFNILERRFPESRFAQLGHERIAVLRDILARNEKIIGDYYHHRANFRAAESRYAELLQRYPDTPIAAKALYDLGTTLKKEGKKYSAAQAFAAFKYHYQNTKYAKEAARELKNLKQPIDDEDDPLKLVLAESGFATAEDDPFRRNVKVHHGKTFVDLESEAPLDAGKLPDVRTLQKAAAAVAKRSSTDSPATLRTIRLASSDPPMSVILDLSAPVRYEKRFERSGDHATLTLHLLNARPGAKLDHHIMFDRSIFKECEIESKSDGTIVRVTTRPISRYAIIPLDGPPRLMVTYTTAGAMTTSMHSKVPGF